MGSDTRYGGGDALLPGAATTAAVSKESAHLTVLSAQSFWKRFPPQRFFAGFVADAIAGARLCGDCSKCEERCPYHLPIREMLTENLAFYDSIAPRAGEPR